MKRTILFVDDEEKVLQGLKRMLYGMRNHWDMLFSSDPREALSIMEKVPVDVVLSDYRMPGMDGNQFLGEVKRLFPDTVRIFLSGQSEKDAFFKASDVAHQYLVKPCDPERLKSVVARTCALRDGLKDPILKQTVSNIGRLPSLPSLYIELMAELKKDDPSTERIANIIASDIAMSTKVLHLINSPFFGLFRKISNPKDAVVYLGVASVKALALGQGVFSQFDAAKLKRCDLDHLWGHSLAVASLARRIASIEKQPKGTVDDSFMSGMLHDLGKLILADVFTDRYEEILKRKRKEQRPLSELETEVFGGDHGRIGGYVMGLWGMPESVVEAIFFSHSPALVPEPAFSPLTAVHAANALEHEYRKGGGAGEEMDRAYIASCVAEARIDKWREMAFEALAEEAP
jgi:HD-like signal output (HDOD) protein/ActR/RegA family two-component response regulator